MQVDIDGDGTPDTTIYPTYNDTIPTLGIEEAETLAHKLPGESGLLMISPNPALSEFQIKYALSYGSHVDVKIYDVTGRIVTTVVDDTQEAGRHGVRWRCEDDDGNAVPSGTYFCRLQAGDFTDMKKMVVVR
jgi:hypothetical protein